MSGHSHGSSGCGDGAHHHESASSESASLAAADLGAPRALSNTAIASAAVLQYETHADDSSLPVAFIHAEALYHHVIEGTPLSSCTNHHMGEHISEAIRCFLRCSSLVRSESIFSSNEAVADINTEDLQYLLIDYYIASLRQQVMGDTR